MNIGLIGYKYFILVLSASWLNFATLHNVHQRCPARGKRRLRMPLGCRPGCAIFYSVFAANIAYYRSLRLSVDRKKLWTWHCL